MPLMTQLGPYSSAAQLLPGVTTPSSSEGGRETEVDRDSGLIAIEKRLDDPNLVERIVEDLERKLAVPTLSDSLSDLPASSESIQVP